MPGPIFTSAEEAIEAQNALIRHLFKTVAILSIATVLAVVALFALLATHTSTESCKKWTIMVRDAGHEACCKGEIKCPR